MIFRNMEALGIDDVHKVLKVGDTASDIKEGKHAGVWSAGVVIGSSEMGLSEEEYQALSPEEQEAKCKETEEKFYAAEPTWCSGLCRTWQRPCKDWKGRARI